MHVMFTFTAEHARVTRGDEGKRRNSRRRGVRVEGEAEGKREPKR